jgi:phosphoglycerate-specific signal transduction histidine kinase
MALQSCRAKLDISVHGSAEMSRAASPETQLRHLKRQVRDLKAVNAILAAEISERRHFGAQMANVCYNLAQHADRTLGPHESEILSGLQKNWDRIKKVTA